MHVDACVGLCEERASMSVRVSLCVCACALLLFCSSFVAPTVVAAAAAAAATYIILLEWTTSLDTSSSTLFVCRGPGTVSSGIYRPPQVIPAYPPGGDTRFFFICSRFPRGHYLLWLVRFSLV